MRKKNICFLHAGIRAYRNKLFEKMHESFKPTFIFYHGKNNLKNKKEFSPKWKTWKTIFPFAIRSKLYSFITPSIIFKIPKYDIIISSDPSSFATHSSFIISKIFRKKFILWGETWIWPNTTLAKISLPYVKHIIKQSDACIVAGKKAKEWFVKQGANPEKIFIAPNSSEDLSKKKHAKYDIIKKYQLENKQVILYLGRIIEYKGLDILLKAFSKIEDSYPDTYLLIAGPDADGFESKCKQLAKKLKLKNYLFVGEIKHEEIINFYKKTSFFVLPSKFRMKDIVPAEAWGLTINEVMSTGKPVISTTAVASAFDLIENNNTGYIVKENDVDELSKAMSKMLINPDKTKRMGMQAQKKIQKEYNYEKQFEGFEKAIKYVMKK